VTLAQSPIPLPSSNPRMDVGHSVWPWMGKFTGTKTALPGGKPWPKITIITPNFNYGELLEETMRSVLCQEYPNLEYFVLDGASKDCSVDVIRKYADQLTWWTSEKDNGQMDAINKGFARASGEIIGWLNSDDIFLPWTLRAVAAIFAQFPEVQWVTGYPARLQDGTVYSLEPFKCYPRVLLQAGLFHGGPGGLGWIQQESTFWRRSLWEKSGLIRTEFRNAGDYELWIRFARHADLYAAPTLLGGFSMRGSLNDSMVNRDRYHREINSIYGELDKSMTDEQKQALADVRKFQKARPSRLRRSIVRRTANIDRFRGPVLKWDFDAQAYTVHQQGFFERW
jgi:glycosyltransferase involved in cell wall biosynthesis